MRLFETRESSFRYESAEKARKKLWLFIVAAALYAATAALLFFFRLPDLAAKYATGGFLGRYAGPYWFLGMLAVAGAVYGYKSRPNQYTKTLLFVFFVFWLGIPSLVFAFLGNFWGREFLWASVPFGIVGSTIAVIAATIGTILQWWHRLDDWQA